MSYLKKIVPFMVLGLMCLTFSCEKVDLSQKMEKTDVDPPHGEEANSSSVGK